MQWNRIIATILYNLINTMSLILCFHLTTTIRSDGPSGFGEFILKILILKLSLTAFFAGIVLSINQFRAPRSRLIYIIPSLLITIFLALTAALGIVEACSDSKGYCRDWQMVAIKPNNSFKPTPLRGAA